MDDQEHQIHTIKIYIYIAWIVLKSKMITIGQTTLIDFYVIETINVL